MLRVLVIAAICLQVECAFLFGDHAPFGGGSCMDTARFCPLSHGSCPYGLMLDGHGCPICHCAEHPLDHSQPAVVHHHIQNPCVPSQSRCTLNCIAYLKTGSCEWCQCDHSVTQRPTVPDTTTTTTTTSGTSAVIPSSLQGNTTSPSPAGSHKCAIAQEVCSLKCGGEYLNDPKDCTFCVCKSDLPGLTNP